MTDFSCFRFVLFSGVRALPERAPLPHGDGGPAAVPARLLLHRRHGRAGAVPARHVRQLDAAAAARGVRAVHGGVVLRRLGPAAPARAVRPGLLLLGGLVHVGAARAGPAVHGRAGPARRAVHAGRLLRAGVEPPQGVPARDVQPAEPLPVDQRLPGLRGAADTASQGLPKPESRQDRQKVSFFFTPCFALLCSKTSVSL